MLAAASVQGPWRGDVIEVLASVVWVTRLRRAAALRATAVTPARTASISMRGVVVPAGRRERLERVCRYALRPPVSGDRVRVQLRHRWADGTTQVVFDPLESLGRLAVLVPRPRIIIVPDEPGPEPRENIPKRCPHEVARC